MPEAAGAFGGFIGPATLLGLVRNTAPWLFPLDAADGARPADVPAGPLQWRGILAAGARLEAAPEPTPAQRTDYFALCLAAHFASAATYVPTDVDTKIRRALWGEAVGTDELERMRALALGLARWDLSLVSARLVAVEGEGIVSGHDGERLSVLCGGMVASRAAGDAAGAAELESAIDAELAREARAFARVEKTAGAELELLRLAGVLTHNAGDVMQSLGVADAPRFADLARGGAARYGGAFARAALLYRELLAAEGHRNYPLRQARALRRGPELLLPIAPFLDDFGVRVARHPALGAEERAEIVAALTLGTQKVRGQSGYFRALAGFASAHPRGLEAPELAAHWPVSVRRALREPELSRGVAVPRASFERSLAKRARELLRRF
jgi:hypothetical protein